MDVGHRTRAVFRHQRTPGLAVIRIAGLIEKLEVLRRNHAFIQHISAADEAVARIPVDICVVGRIHSKEKAERTDGSWKVRSETSSISITPARRI